MAAVGVWPIPWALYGRLGGVYGPLGPVWLHRKRGRSYGFLMAAVKAWLFPLGPGRPLWKRGQSPGLWMGAVGAWPLPWGPYSCRGGLAVFLGPVCPPWGRGWCPWPRMA